MARSAEGERKTSKTRERILSEVPPLRVGVREFRTNLEHYACEGVPLVITRHGEEIAAFLPLNACKRTGAAASDPPGVGIIKAARRLADALALEDALKNSRPGR